MNYCLELIILRLESIKQIELALFLFYFYTCKNHFLKNYKKLLHGLRFVLTIRRLLHYYYTHVRVLYRYINWPVTVHVKWKLLPSRF